MMVKFDRIVKVEHELEAGNVLELRNGEKRLIVKEGKRYKVVDMKVFVVIGEFENLEELFHFYNGNDKLGNVKNIRHMEV